VVGTVVEMDITVVIVLIAAYCTIVFAKFFVAKPNGATAEHRTELNLII